VVPLPLVAPELGERLHALQERLRMIGMVDLALITIAAIAMETARFVSF